MKMPTRQDEKPPQQIGSVFQSIIDTALQKHREGIQELFGEYSSPSEAISNLSPRYATLLTATIGSTSASPIPVSQLAEKFHVPWWRTIERRMDSCERCLQQKLPGGMCASEGSGIDVGMLPVWKLVGDSLEPGEDKCTHWAEYSMRKRMLEAGVPEHLIGNICDAPMESELLTKLRTCYDHRAVLGVIGKAPERTKALVTMTRFLSRQPKHKGFRIELINVDFRKKMKKEDAADLVLELLHYKWCLFLVFSGVELPDWMKSEMDEILEYRGMYHMPTVVLDATSVLLKPLKGKAEVLGCQV
jgi:hypothetical protein